MRAMQVIAATASVSRAERAAAIRSAALAVLLLVTGGLLAWVCLATPLVAQLTPTGRPSAGLYLTGMIVWGFALLVPGGFLIAGIARAARAAETLVGLQSNSALPRLANELGAEHLAVTDFVLPGGRRIAELLLGPFGVLVLGDVPPPGVSRHVGPRWEVRGPRGRWIPIEGPLDRAARDAERLRGWLTSDDRDFLVRVYAAVVTEDRRVERTPVCAVVAPAELRDWILRLPVQRGLTADRRARLTALFRSVVDGS